MEIESLKASILAVHKEVKRKFQLPIVITYSIILIVFNWDILFYLLFEKKSAIIKIEFVKENFYTEYADRIWKPILLAILYSILFPFIQVLVNQVIQFFKQYNNKITRKEELDNAIHNFAVQQQLSGQQSLQQLQGKIDQLVIEKDQLLSANNSLIAQLKTETDETLNSTKIFDAQFDKISKKLLEDISSFSDEEKSILVEVLDAMQNQTDSISLNNLKSKTIFPENAKKVLVLMKKHKLVDFFQGSSDEYYATNQLGLKFIPHFKSKYIK